MKIYLLGKHSHRTPFSYDEYKSIFQDSFTYVNKPEDADFIVFGFYIDIKENISIIKHALAINPNIKVVVLSEEPLWDTLWSGDFTKKRQKVNIEGFDLEYYFLNHQTTSIFNFEKIPYFLTTSDDYIVRYHSLFKNNSMLTSSDIKDIWAHARVDKAFYAEHRLGDKYNVIHKTLDTRGLCSFRTELTSKFVDEGALIVGQGWSETEKRQKLADWHLDKLAALHHQTFMISALENTHQPSYITEKIFDAFSALAVPIYFSSNTHSVNKIVNKKTFINVFDKTVDAAASSIKSFEFNDEFVSGYKQQQVDFYNLFSDYKIIYKERNRVSHEIYKELSALYILLK